MIADNQLNVRQAEALCKKLAKPAKEPVAAPLPSALPVEVEESLKQALGSEVRVAYHDGKGKLTVHFYSDDQRGVTSQSRCRSTALLKGEPEQKSY